MRYVIFSDVHSNIEAFQSVLKEIEKLNIDQRLFLGDIVGYGANPNEAIDMLKSSADIILAGNHDYAAVDMTDITYFNPHAKEAVLWTKEILKQEHKEYLKKLPESEQLEKIKQEHEFFSKKPENIAPELLKNTELSQEKEKSLKQQIMDKIVKYRTIVDKKGT